MSHVRGAVMSLSFILLIYPPSPQSSRRLCVDTSCRLLSVVLSCWSVSVVVDGSFQSEVRVVSRLSVPPLLLLLLGEQRFSPGRSLGSQHRPSPCNSSFRHVGVGWTTHDPELYRRSTVGNPSGLIWGLRQHQEYPWGIFGRVKYINLDLKRNHAHL